MPQGKEKLKTPEKKKQKQLPVKREIKKGRVEKLSKKSGHAQKQKLKKQLAGKHIQDIEDMTAKKVLHSSGKLAVLKTMEEKKKKKKNEE